MLSKNAAIFFFFIILFVANNISESSIDSDQFQCSETCVVEDCNSTFVMRYGKYCGVGWSGCPGEKPCDDLDACCQFHDECVDKYGMTNIECHEECKSCITKVEMSGKVGFSNSCPYDVALPTLLHSMDLSILLSQFDDTSNTEEL